MEESRPLRFLEDEGPVAWVEEPKHVQVCGFDEVGNERMVVFTLKSTLSAIRKFGQKC